MICVIDMVYVGIYNVAVGVDIGIRHPPPEDDTTHKLIGRLKLPTYLIASLFSFLKACNIIEIMS